MRGHQRINHRGGLVVENCFRILRQSPRNGHGAFRAGAELVGKPVEKFADFDGASPMVKALDEAGARRLSSKLQKCILGSNSFVSVRMLDLSNVIEGETPKFIVSSRYRIAAGKMEDFRNLMKSDVLPVYKKAKVGVTVGRRTLGSNTNDVTVSIAYNKYADLDGGHADSPL